MRYAYLDGLRGLAILGVVATHIGQVVQGLPSGVSSNLIWGIRGVQLFFMVSALTLLLVTKPETFSLSDFAARRFFRIAPMFYLAAAFYTVAAYTGWIVPRGGPPSVMDVGLTFAFLHGFNPDGINNVVPGGWSIACEAIFYALFIVILPCASSVKRSMALVAGAMVLTCIALLASFALKKSVSSSGILDFFHFNFLMNCLPFAFGFLNFALLKKFCHEDWLLRRAGSMQAIFLVCILAYGAIAPNTVAAEVPFAFLLAGFVFFVAIKPPAILVGRPFQLLGELSFSVYLVHFVVIHTVAMNWRPRSPAVDLLAVSTMTFAGSIVLAIFCHKFIERPFITLGRRLTARETSNNHQRDKTYAGSHIADNRGAKL